jgi:hypothetical protein
MISGHQYDQTIRFAALVLRSTFAKVMSSVSAARPPTIRRINTPSVRT